MKALSFSCNHQGSEGEGGCVISWVTRVPIYRGQSRLPESKRKLINCLLFPGGQLSSDSFWGKDSHLSLLSCFNLLFRSPICDCSSPTKLNRKAVQEAYVYDYRQKGGGSILHVLRACGACIVRLCISRLVNVVVIYCCSFSYVLTLFPYSKSFQPHVKKTFWNNE